MSDSSSNSEASFPGSSPGAGAAFLRRVVGVFQSNTLHVPASESHREEKFQRCLDHALGEAVVGLGKGAALGGVLLVALRFGNRNVWNKLGAVGRVFPASVLAGAVSVFHAEKGLEECGGFYEGKEKNKVRGNLKIKQNVFDE